VAVSASSKRTARVANFNLIQLMSFGKNWGERCAGKRWRAEPGISGAPFTGAPPSFTDSGLILRVRVRILES
jgi:hypothetical protein